MTDEERLLAVAPGLRAHLRKAVAPDGSFISCKHRDDARPCAVRRQLVLLCEACQARLGAELAHVTYRDEQTGKEERLIITNALLMAAICDDEDREGGAGR